MLHMMAQQQREVQASEAHLYDLIDKNADGMMVMDTHGTVRYINRALGCTAGQGYWFAKPADHEVAKALLATAPRW